MSTNFKIGDKVFRNNKLETIIHIDIDDAWNDYRFLISNYGKREMNAFANIITPPDIIFHCDYFQTKREQNSFIKKFKLSKETFIEGCWYEWVREEELILANPLDVILIELKKEIL